MGGDSFGMAAPNDHCHRPCTMSFPRFQCVERQRLLTASFLLQKEAKDCIGKLFLMGLLCTCLACLNSTTTLFLFSFQFLSYFLVFSVKWNLYMAISLPLINFHPYKDEISIFQSTIIIMKFEFKTLYRLLKLLSLLES